MTCLRTLLYIVAPFAILLAGAAHPENSILVLSAEEFDANLSYGERGVELTRKRTDPSAPLIVIDTPDLGADVAPPVDVAVSFQAADGASIDLDTLKVRYGWFDITARVRETMRVTPEGIAGRIEGMRRGKYTLKVSISDNMRRTSKTNIVFEVVSLSATEHAD